jgi:predicted dehydrogenase
MATLRVLGVGAGYFSQFQYQAWQEIPRAECVGIVNRDQAKATALAARFRIPRVLPDLEQALEALHPDLLDIITPPETHLAFATQAIARGIPVVCQKPFCRNYAEALALTELAQRAGVPLVVHENFRWQPWWREVKRLLDTGALGQLHALAFRLRPGDGQGPAAYCDRQPYFQRLPRFLVRETAIHFIDTFRFLAGEISSVFALLRRLNPVIAGEDAGVLLFEHAGGATSLFDGNRLNEHPAADLRRTMGEGWIEGATGVLRLDGDGRLWWKPHGGPERPHEFDAGPREGFGGGACAALQRHLVAHFLDGAPVENTAQAYLANLRVEEAAYRSAAEGRRIDLACFDPLDPTVHKNRNTEELSCIADNSCNRPPPPAPASSS